MERPPGGEGAGADFRYGLEDRPPWLELLLFGLQWLAISVPTIVIIGKVVAALHFSDYPDQVLYLQKVSFVTAVALLAQVLWGHRLPLLLGPATVLLIGITASQAFSLDTIYSSLLLGGLVLALLSATGLFGRLQRLFTPRVVAVVLLLIAFTLTPTVVGLITGGGGGVPLTRLGFALGLVAAMFVAHRALGGVWRSTLIVWATAAGSLAYLLLFPGDGGPGHEALRGPWFSGFLRHCTGHLSVNPGVLISFLLCFVALSINDFGSIQSLSELLRPSRMGSRITRGMTLTGLANVLSGFLGVVGPVDYSLSPGVIVATGCASRFTLIPAGLVLLVLSFSPAVIGWIGAVPSVVIGGVLIYVLSAQVAAGLMVAFPGKGSFAFEDGLVIGLPVLLGAIIATLPQTAVATFPVVLRPVLGNGFAVGVVAALLMEHGVFRR